MAQSGRSNWACPAQVLGSSSLEDWNRFPYRTLPLKSQYGFTPCPPSLLNGLSESDEAQLRFGGISWRRRRGFERARSLSRWFYSKSGEEWGQPCHESFIVEESLFIRDVGVCSMRRGILPRVIEISLLERKSDGFRRWEAPLNNALAPR